MLTEIQSQKIKALLRKSVETGTIELDEVKEIAEKDSDAYEEILDMLSEEGIETLVAVDDQNRLDINVEEDEDDSKFEKDLKEDPNFKRELKEIEEDLKTKDIDEMVATISAPMQVDDPVKLYFNEMGRIRLLTMVEEIDYSRKVQDGLLADEKLKACDEKHVIEITPEERKDLDRKVDIGFQARDIMIESNLRLVISVAKKFSKRGLSFQDLIQEGNLGLIKAVNKFDPNKGFRFSTYAHWWIKQAITRAIADQGRTIRIPVHMVETINKLTRTQRKMTQELHREPTSEELAKALGITPEKVQHIQSIAIEPVSLEKPVGEEEDSTMEDFVADHSTENPMEYSISEAYKEEIDKVLKTLTPREEKVLRLRFGLTDGKPRTLEEVGKEFGVTRERIRQIEAKAIRRLRHPTRQRRLSQYK